MSIESKTILVRSYTGKNVGDDLFLKILFERYPYINFLFLISNKEYIKWKEKHNNISFVFLPMRSIFNRIFFKVISFFDNGKLREKYLGRVYHKFYSSFVDKIDACVYIGGSLCFQHTKGIKIRDKIEMIIINALKSKPQYLLGVNFGPFIENQFLNYYKSVFCRYSDICFRDSYSYSHFKELPNVRFEKDIVFSGNFDRKQTKKKGSVGFSIIDLPGYHRRIAAGKTVKRSENVYMDTIEKLVKIFLTENRHVYFFSFCMSEGDEKAITRVLKKLPIPARKKIKIILYRGDLEYFISEYMKIETMVVTRFHAMVLSLMANQFVYPFIYNIKMINVLNDLKYNGPYSFIDNIDSIENILYGLKSKKYLLPLSSVRQSAERQFSALDKFITNN